MIELIEQSINKIDDLIKEQLSGSKYQFELHDLITNTKHFRGYDEPFHWGSIYKLFLIVSVLKKIDEKAIDENYILNLDKSQNVKGAGIFKQIKHLDKLNIIDACRFIIATSDALISDTLFEMIGVDTINKTLLELGMTNSRVTDNLESIVSSILPENYREVNANYIYSGRFYENYSETLPRLLKRNYTTAHDINIGFNNAATNYLSISSSVLFKEIIQVPNVWSRFSQYIFFSNKIGLRGKTGTLGFGIVVNECAAIIDLNTNSILGYFSVLSKDNKKTIYNVYDIIGLIGLEIVNLYEQLNK